MHKAHDKWGKTAKPEQAEVAPLVVSAVNFVPWQYAVAVTNVRLHSTAVSHSVCLVFSSTLPEFSLSATRQHMHIRGLFLWGGESLSVAIINTSVAAWHIKPLSETPALHVLSTK